MFAFPLGILIAIIVLFCMLGGFWLDGLADEFLHDPTGALKAALIIAGILSVLFFVRMACDADETSVMSLCSIIPSTIALAGGLFFVFISMADFINEWEWSLLLATIPILIGYCIGFLLIIVLPLIVVLLPQTICSLEGGWGHLIGMLISTVLAIIYSCIMCLPAFYGRIGFYFNLN